MLNPTALVRLNNSSSTKVSDNSQVIIFQPNSTRFKIKDSFQGTERTIEHYGNIIGASQNYIEKIVEKN